MYTTKLCCSSLNNFKVNVLVQWSSQNLFTHRLPAILPLLYLGINIKKGLFLLEWYSLCIFYVTIFVHVIFCMCLQFICMNIWMRGERGVKQMYACILGYYLDEMTSHFSRCPSSPFLLDFHSTVCTPIIHFLKIQPPLPVIDPTVS